MSLDNLFVQIGMYILYRVSHFRPSYLHANASECTIRVITDYQLLYRDTMHSGQQQEGQARIRFTGVLALHSV